MYRSPRSDIGTTAAWTSAGILMLELSKRRVTCTAPETFLMSVTCPTSTPSTLTLTPGKTWTAREKSARYTEDWFGESEQAEKVRKEMSMATGSRFTTDPLGPGGAPT